METAGDNAKLNWRSRHVRLKVLSAALLGAVLCYSFFNWVLWPVKVVGESMLPNYDDGGHYFINKLAYASALPHRGDVIALRGPDDEVYLKRIVGLPGETVSFDQGLLHINGRLIAEPYTRTRVPRKWRKTVRLRAEEYFVIGDNRGISVFSPIRASQIMGKVL